MGALSLHAADWAVIGVYLLLALGAGLWMREKASSDRESYFLAGRSLPWWWAGASIAATTFAADTPLAVTGIVASRGMGGNWIWLSWMGVHAAVVVLFARAWSKSGVITDAEFVAQRYSGRAAGNLRWMRAGLYGVLYNGIILGWVLRAMVKIASPYFAWDQWLPGTMRGLSRVWPEGTPLGTPSEGLTIVLLLGLVAVYSSLGGIRGVMLTDLVQLGLALVGSLIFAWKAWDAVGGREGLVGSLSELYGPDNDFLSLAPDASSGLGLLALFLIVQSYANVPADGGGYLMQRLNSTRSPRDAEKASVMFMLLQYGLRVWPWLIVALAALVLVPIGAEVGTLGGAGDVIAADRELAYPVLMGALLGPGLLGVMVASLLAAFMSTVDTHMNWGASYVVNDVYLRLKPDATPQAQVRVARIAVVGFAIAAVLVCSQINTIEQAWKWVAAIGAALGVPTALRWVWWRVTAVAEISAIGAGLAVALYLTVTDALSYESGLIVISAASLVGMLAGIAFGPRTDPAVLDSFAAKVDPPGFWPGRPMNDAIRSIATRAGRWALVVGGTVTLLFATHRLLLTDEVMAGIALGVFAVAALWAGTRATGDASTSVHGEVDLGTSDSSK